MNSPLPRAARAQLEAAERLEQELATQVANQSEPPPLVATPAVAAEPPPPPAPIAEPPKPADTFEQKYKTLQGMYNAHMQQMPALKQQVAQLSQQLEQAIKALNEAKAGKPAAATEDAGKTVVDPRDAQAFGDDFVEMVSRYVNAARTDLFSKFHAAVTELSERIGALEQTVNGVSQQAAVSGEQQFYASLATMVPDWQDINTSPEFGQWLSQVNPEFGVSRQTALEHAHQALDAQRVAAIFRSFQQSQRAAVPPPVPVADPLASQVTPSTTGAQPPSPPAAAPLVSQKQVTKFYDDLARGRYRGREQEAASIEAQINQALAEGRVR